MKTILSHDLRYCPKCSEKLCAIDNILPEGVQAVSEIAIAWLYDNHRDVYDEFYKRL